MTGSLREIGFRGGILCEEPLARYTTWKIGGPAELMVSPADRDDLACCVEWASRTGTPWRVLGNGSNLLVRDEGVRGLVIRLRKVLDEIDWQGPRVVAWAGAMLPAVANQAASRGMAGLEFAAGIPGTVGGAVIMNAGWHQFEIANVIERVELLEADGRRRTLPAEACGFGYRRSAFRERRVVVLCATLSLRPDDPAAVRQRLETYAESRKRNQPTEQPSCGSVFLKPEGDFAGRLIEAAGLKGLRVGDVEVSRKHANFFVNRGRARATDVLELVERVEAEVERRFGVRLVREFEVW